jgi:hypothetical protein
LLSAWERMLAGRMRPVVEDHSSPPRSRVSPTARSSDWRWWWPWSTIPRGRRDGRHTAGDGRRRRACRALERDRRCEVRTRRPVARAHVGEIAADVGAVAFGVGFPAVFFLLAVAGVWRLRPPSGSPSGRGWAHQLVRLFRRPARRDRMPGGARPGSRGRPDRRLFDRAEGVRPLSSATRTFARAWHEYVTLGSRRCELGEVE